MISKFSVKKPYTILVAVVMVIILGIVSLTKMTADLLPNINLPYVIVMTTYVGASPETVEAVVTKPVESSMATVSNVESISSTSGENYSMVIMEFAQSANMDSVSLEIREKLDQVKPYWDESVGNPVIMKLNPNMLPIMVAAVGMEGMSTAEISDYTRDYLLPELESIEGVASASASGLLQEQVNVIIREDKIAEVNKLIFASIDEEMEEAQQEILDGKKEIADGRAEIADKQKEMEDAKADLLEGQQDLDFNRAQLENSKYYFNDQKESAAAMLAENHAKLIDAKSQIAAGKGAIQATMAQLQQQLAAIETKEKMLSAQTAMANYKATHNIDDATAMMTPWESIKADFSTADQEIINGLAEAVQGQGLPATLGALELAVKTQLDLPTMQSVDVSLKPTLQAGLQEAQTQLDTLTAQEAEIDKGLEALVKGQVEAAAGLGSAGAQISYGQAQIEAAQGQLDSVKEQLDAGVEQIDSAKEQLDEAEEQLRDAEEQLEDARQDAYLNADMAGVLTVETVKSLLVAQNFSMPGGYVTEDGVDYLVRVGEKPEDVDELAAMPLLNLNMDGVKTITLSDVADVFMTDNSADIYANLNGNPGVLISLQKQTGYSTGDVSDKIKDKFADISEENSDISLIELMDQGIYIDMVTDSIFSNIIVGFGLAMIILIVFLRDYKPTLVIACSIPISLVAAIVCMYFSGVTLNIISLSGLALAIGMLVDNSIVVIENIYRMRSEGASIKEASIEGAKEVAGAIVASTLTTVCVFLPIVFTEGITRQLFVDMGLTIGYSLVASLVMALTVVPAMASKVLTNTKEPKVGGWENKLSSLLEKVLRGCLRRKGLVILATVFLLVLSTVLSVSKGTAFMPEMDSNQISMTITPQDEMSLEETVAISDEVVKRLETISDIQDIGAMVSDSSTAMLGGGTANAVSIYITTKEDKEYTNIELGRQIEELLQDIKGVDIAVQTASMDMSALGGSGISIQVKGRELETLQKVAQEVASVLQTVEGVDQVSDGLEETSGEMKILVDKNKAMDYGLTVGQVFAQISAKLAAPTSATTLTTDIKEFDVYVVSEADDALTRETLKAISIDGTDEDGKKVKVPLSDIATFEESRSLNAIQRSEQTRYIAVSATIEDGYNIGLVSADVEKALEQYDLPKGYSLHFGGENETIMEAMGQLALMLVLAIAFMYLIMVAQFQSLKSPFIIMFTIPLAFTGGFLGLFLSGSEMSVIAVIGFIMLAGIIVNNGIVLVDYTNQLRERGMEKNEAIIESVKTRLRPVLMTALTTILGLLPMVVGGGMGADMSRPMAIVTIGGLTYGTLLTLIVIPCIYDIFHPVKS